MKKKDQKWYDANVHPLAQKLCKADEGNQESNFGQMLELLNDLADEINKAPVEVLRVILELSERRK